MSAAAGGACDRDVRKQRGRSRFRVDLLAPVPGEATKVVPVPELGTHATGLPYLGFLLAESQQAPALAREGCCMVRVPLPERFAVHKLIASRLRPGRSAKSERDLFQAAVVSAALAECHPGALAEAVRAVPRRAVKRLRQALAAAEPLLTRGSSRAWEELNP